MRWAEFIHVGYAMLDVEETHGINGVPQGTVPLTDGVAAIKQHPTFQIYPVSKPSCPKRSAHLLQPFSILFRRPGSWYTGLLRKEEIPPESLATVYWWRHRNLYSTSILH